MKMGQRPDLWRYRTWLPAPTWTYHALLVQVESSTQPEKVRVPFVGGGISMRATVQAVAGNLRFCFVRQPSLF